MEFTDILFDKGLAFAEGERWKKQRTSLAPSFQFDVLKSRIVKINEIIEGMVQKMDIHEGKLIK